MGTTESETLYRRLQQHLDRNFAAFPATASGVEIRILEQLFTAEEAEITLELSALPEPAATIHKRFGSRLSLDELRGKLDRMEARGLILAHPVDGERRYAKLPYVVGIYERHVRTLTAELERDTRQYLAEGLAVALHTGPTKQMRVVPINRKIAVDRGVATYDEIRAHVESSPGPFGVMPCICRKGKDLLGDPCKQTHGRDNCLVIGAAAQWAIGSGNGKEITRAEMLGLLDQADRDGLVLQPENTKSPLFICCCCGCCCNALTAAKRFAKPAQYFSSNFYAEVDAEVCQSCGECRNRCQMDAISSPEGPALVDRSRCIGCGLCLSTCPSGALSLKQNPALKEPPEDTRGLYLRLFRERYGAAEMAKIGVQHALGRKI